jgi:hypothetical protein
MALAGNAIAEVAEGHLASIVYAAPEERAVTRSGLGRTQPVILLADLGNSGRLSLSLEVSRNQSVNYARKPAILIFVLAVLVTFALAWFWRRRNRYLSINY